MRMCKTCGRPINRGGGSGGTNGLATCLVCHVDRSFDAWHYQPKAQANKAERNRRYRDEQKLANIQKMRKP